MTPASKVPNTLGRYMLRHHLAGGGMGAVYLAQLVVGEAFSKWVAIKVVHPEVASDPAFEAMFTDEARIAAMIDHPNVAHVFDFGVDAGVLYLAMEYLHGESLSAVARKGWARGGVPTLFAARVVADAARGLHAAHELKLPDGRPAEVVHRDVSPQNIFVLYDGLSKIVDFGVAKSNERLSERTATDVLKGKIAYLAPEQLRREAVDRRVDVFALGIVLWEITVGRRLFRADNEAATVLMIVKGEVQRPSEIHSDFPLDLEQIVMKALESDRDRRYATAADMARDLDRFIASRGIPFGAAEVSDVMHGLFPDEIHAREQLLASSRHTGSASTAGVFPGPASDSLSFKQPLAVEALEATVVSTRGPLAPVEKSAVIATSTSIAAVRDVGSRPVGSAAWKWLSLALGMGVVASGGWLARKALFAPSQSGSPPIAAAPTTADAETRTQPRADVPAAPLAPASQRIRIATEPPAASLTIDGAPVSNPFAGDLLTGSTVHRLEARAPGFAPTTQDLVVPWPPDVTIRLRRAVVIDEHHGDTRRHGGSDSGTGRRAPQFVREF
ncbi:MAG: protein kinase [Deltaproteobacteria bacterium]